MGFAVDPAALRTFARQLTDAQEVAEAAKRYVDRHGTFSMHEGGLISLALPRHQNLLTALDQFLAHLGTLADASSQAMNNMATHYERTDLKAEATVDAAYPSVPRPPIDRD
jgi:hypothetical protein